MELFVVWFWVVWIDFAFQPVGVSKIYEVRVLVGGKEVGLAHKKGPIDKD